MKVVKALAPAALIAVIFCAWADAEDSKTGGPVQPEGVPAKEFKAKAGYCETCHGLSARGFIGTNPMPRSLRASSLTISRTNCRPLSIAGG